MDESERKKKEDFEQNPDDMQRLCLALGCLQKGFDKAEEFFHQLTADG